MQRTTIVRLRYCRPWPLANSGVFTGASGTGFLTLRPSRLSMDSRLPPLHRSPFAWPSARLARRRCEDGGVGDEQPASHDEAELDAAESPGLAEREGGRESHSPCAAPRAVLRSGTMWATPMDGRSTVATARTPP